VSEEWLVFARIYTGEEDKLDVKKMELLKFVIRLSCISFEAPKLI
jgi:uncharacterized protein Smg (DUF494 family)